MMLTNCCEAPFYDPGWPDVDICTACKEHAVPIEEKIRKYRPLPDYLTVKRSKVNGNGLFAIKKIEGGKRVGVTHYDLKGEIWNELMRTPLGGFINHSSEPNCILDKTSEILTWVLYTLRDIKRGEELTIKYETYKVE